MTSYSVSRSRTIAAPSERVHALLNDFRNWQQWSPWEGLDPDLHRTYTGPESGVGALYAWMGNRKAGAGAMEIIASAPDAIRIKLEFLKPWRATSDTTFTLAPESAGTRVTWSMTGTHGGLFGLFGRFMNFDKLVGPDFEKGLDQLARAAEADAPG